MHFFLQRRTSCASLFYLAIYFNNIYKNLIAFEVICQICLKLANEFKRYLRYKGEFRDIHRQKSCFLKNNRINGKENGAGKLGKE